MFEQSYLYKKERSYKTLYSQLTKMSKKSQN